MPVTPRLIALLLLGMMPGMQAHATDTPQERVRVDASARAAQFDPVVRNATDELIQLTSERQDSHRLLDRLQAIQDDPGLSPAQRDAAIYSYVDDLRRLPPGSAPDKVLTWLQSVRPQAVTGHQESPQHEIALFNIAGAAAGLANQWQWQQGQADLAGSQSLPVTELVSRLSGHPPGSPYHNGLRAALASTPINRLNQLAGQCPTDCNGLKADIELARGNLAWLHEWLETASANEAMPRLRRARDLLEPDAATSLIQAALDHPQAGVAAWAMADLTAHLPKDTTEHRRWGETLLGMLDDDRLGSVAALQLARMNAGDWLQQATADQAVSERVARRLELIAELEQTLRLNAPEESQ